MPGVPLPNLRQSQPTTAQQTQNGRLMGSLDEPNNVMTVENSILKEAGPQGSSAAKPTGGVSTAYAIQEGSGSKAPNSMTFDLEPTRGVANLGTQQRPRNGVAPDSLSDEVAMGRDGIEADEDDDEDAAVIGTHRKGSIQGSQHELAAVNRFNATAKN